MLVADVAARPDGPGPVRAGRARARRGRATGEGGAARLIVGAAGTVVLVVVTLGLLVGGRGQSSSPSNERADAPVQPSEEAAVVPLRPPAIRLVASPEGELPKVPEVVGRVADGTVMVVGLSGLEARSQGSIHQCPSGARTPSECRPGLPVQVGKNGRAVVLVDLEDRLPVDEARPVDCTEAPGCSIVLFGSARLEAITVFGAPAPPPVTLAAAPARVQPGGTTVATARRLPPGATASFTVCRPLGRGGADCGALTPAGTADASGQASARVAIPAGRCPRGATCALAVVVDDGTPMAYAPLRLIGRPGAAYDGGRLRAGVVAAGLLALVATWLVRRTDWASVEPDPFAGVTLPEDPFA